MLFEWNIQYYETREEAERAQNRYRAEGYDVSEVETNRYFRDGGKAVTMTYSIQIAYNPTHNED